MLPGPVFTAELSGISRRVRSYALRFFYGLLLLLLIWEYCFRSLPGRFDRTGQTMTIADMAALAFSIFRTFAITQAVVLVFLTPALVAGVIADERQRKTLDYLLGSRLSSAEIVLGKLTARLLQVGVFVTLGVPIQCLMSLFGGIPLELILLVYAATCSTVLFLAAVSVAVSTYSRRPRDAIGLMYIFLVVWMFMPTLVATWMPSGTGIWFRLYEWIRPINEWVGATSPFYIMASGYFSSRGRNGPLEGTAWMIGLQLGWGLILVLWSIARLRPVFRKAGEPSRWIPWGARGKRGKRLLPRPPCGDDAMLWKERHVGRTSRAIKIAGLLIATCVGALLAYTTFRLAAPAFEELTLNGFETLGSNADYQNRGSFNLYVRLVGCTIYVVWAFVVASAGATSITSEREADTWTSLVASPLDAWEIVRAKMLGAVWGARWLGAVLLTLLLTGVAAGSVHPVCLLATTVETLVFIWFAAALGTLVSLKSKTSTRAVTATIGILLVANGGYLMCCIPLLPDSHLVLAGVTPFAEVGSLMSYPEFWDVMHGQSSEIGFGDIDTVLTCAFSTLLYAIAAFALTALSVVAFDDELDRPRQGSAAPEVPHAKRYEPVPADADLDEV